MISRCSLKIYSYAPLRLQCFLNNNLFQNTSRMQSSPSQNSPVSSQPTQWNNDDFKMARCIAEFSINSRAPVPFHAISGRIIRENPEINRKVSEIDEFVKTFANNSLAFFPRIHPWLYAKIFFVCDTPLSSDQIEMYTFISQFSVKIFIYLQIFH